jgi:hypothetical protein
VSKNEFTLRFLENFFVPMMMTEDFSGIVFEKILRNARTVK